MIDFHYNLVLQPDGSAQKVLKTLLYNLPAEWEKFGIGVSYNPICWSRQKEGVKFWAVPEERFKNWVCNKLLGLKLFTYRQIVELLNRYRPMILHIHNRCELVDKLLALLSYSPKVICHYHRFFNSPFIPAKAHLLIGVSKAVSNFLRQKSREKGLKIEVETLHNPIPYDLLQYPSTPFRTFPLPNLFFSSFSTPSISHSDLSQSGFPLSLYNSNLSFKDIGSTSDLNSLPANISPFPTDKFKRGQPLKLLFPFGNDSQKGFDRILDFILRLPEKFPFQFYIAGKIKGNLPEPLRRLNPVITGYLSPDNYYRLLREMDLLILPTRREAFSLSLLEGLYFGVRVIISKTGGVPEVVGEDYPLFIPPDPTDKELERKFWEGVTLSPEVLEPYRQKILEQFNPIKVGKKLAEIYTRLVNYPG